MNNTDILLHRLYNQKIAATNFTKPEQIVSWLGAVQAQDYNMAKWAIGLRLNNTTIDTVERAIDSGKIIRTHILRPTWHFVAAEDIRWMLKLSAPQIKKAMVSMNHKLGLDEKLFAKSNELIEKTLLKTEQHFTRQELMQVMNKAGIKTDSLIAVHIMFHAELDGIVCNGLMRGKQFTYALLDKRIAKTKNEYSKEEAIAKLAARYFTSHGPATVGDFCWWSGLTMTDAKHAVELIKADFNSEKIGEKNYLFSSENIANKRREGIHLLPSYDEFMVSYKDRSASLSPKYNKQAITRNGIFNPVIIVNGKTVGLWKRVIKNETVTISIQPFDKKMKFPKKNLDAGAKQYASFLKIKSALLYD